MLAACLAIRSLMNVACTDGEAFGGKTDNHMGGQDDLDDLYGGDAVEAAGETAAGGDPSDSDAEVGVQPVTATHD